jgi:hypothetical protein
MVHAATVFISRHGRAPGRLVTCVTSGLWRFIDATPTPLRLA